MSRVKVRDPETGEVGYIDDEDESVPFVPIGAAPVIAQDPPDYASQPAPDFITFQAPTAQPPAPTPPVASRRRAAPPAPMPAGTAPPRHGRTREAPSAPGRISPEESFARATGQSLTSGFQDEASAGAVNVAEWLAGRLEGPIDDPAEWERQYRSNRDQMRSENRAAAEANPNATLAGDLLGGGVSMAIPGGGVVRGALEGAAAGYGYSDAEDDPTDEILLSGAFGGGAPLLGQVVGAAGRGMRAVGGKLASDVADAWHARIPGQIPEEYASRPNGPAELGRKYQSEDIGNEFLAGPAEAHEAASRVVDRTNDEFSSIHDALGGATVPVSSRQIEQLDAYIPESMARKNNTAASARGMIENDGSGGTFRQAHDARQVLDEGIERTASELEERSRAALRREISEEMERAAVAGGQGDQWTAANLGSHIGQTAKASAAKGLNRLANYTPSEFGREAGIATLIGSAPVAMEANSQDGTVVGGGSKGLGTAAAALATQMAMRGRYPAAARGVSRVAGRAGGGVGAGLEALGGAIPVAARSQAERVNDPGGRASGVTSLRNRYEASPEAFAQFLDDRMIETLENGDEQDIAALNYELSADPNYRRLMSMENTHAQ